MCWLDLMAYLCARGEKLKNYHFIDQEILTVKDKKNITNTTSLVAKNAYLINK